MQNNTTAAAASGMGAAAASKFAQKFEALRRAYVERIISAPWSLFPEDAFEEKTPEPEVMSRILAHEIDGADIDAFFENGFGLYLQAFKFMYSTPAESEALRISCQFFTGTGTSGGTDILVRDFLLYKAGQIRPFDYAFRVMASRVLRRAIADGRVSFHEVARSADFELVPRSSLSFRPGDPFRSFPSIFSGANFVFRVRPGAAFPDGALYADPSDAFFCAAQRTYDDTNSRLSIFASWTFAEVPTAFGRRASADITTKTGFLNSFEVSSDCFATGGILDGANVVWSPALGARVHESAFHLTDIFLNVDLGFYQHVSEGFLWADGSFHSRPEGEVCGPNEAVGSYHSGASGSVPAVRFSRNTPLLLGFEIEKEDRAVKCSLRHSDFRRLLPGFRKERDGSLLSDPGFEFITPPMEACPKGIRAYFESRPEALAHLNAAFPTGENARCGGHVHASFSGLTGPELFDKIAGHLPLIYALFPRRADGTAQINGSNGGTYEESYYCKARPARSLRSSGDKFQAVKVMPDRIEFRIFPAVRNLDNLLWRAALIKKLVNSPAATPAEGYELLPKFFAHLMKIYSGKDELERLIKRVEKYARKYEGFQADPGHAVVSPDRYKIYRPASGPAKVREARAMSSVIS